MLGIKSRDKVYIQMSTFAEAFKSEDNDTFWITVKKNPDRTKIESIDKITLPHDEINLIAKVPQSRSVSNLNFPSSQQLQSKDAALEQSQVQPNPDMDDRPTAATDEALNTASSAKVPAVRRNKGLYGSLQNKQRDVLNAIGSQGGKAKSRRRQKSSKKGGKSRRKAGSRKAKR